VPVHETPSPALQPERLRDAQFHNWCRLAIARITRPSFQADQTPDILAHYHADVLLTVLAAAKM